MGGSGQGQSLVMGIDDASSREVLPLFLDVSKTRLEMQHVAVQQISHGQWLPRLY